MSCEYYTIYILTQLPFTKLVQQSENNHIYFTYLLRIWMTSIKQSNSIFIRQQIKSSRCKQNVSSRTSYNKAKADANFFLWKSNLEEDLIGYEMSGYSDPAVPWLRLRKAEIKSCIQSSIALPVTGVGWGLCIVRRGSVRQQCWWKESMESFFQAMCF